jgi:hypothetical protein
MTIADRPGRLPSPQPGQKKALRRIIAGALSKLVGISLANFRPHRTAVALEANLAAGKQIGYGGNSFSRAFGARTDRHDQIAEGKFGTGLEDLCLFHVWMSGN